MKTEQRTVYVARDGQEFPTEGLCRAHERQTCGAALVGLSEAQIEAARNGEDPDLADAIEIFGAQLRKARQASGQLKRKRNDAGGHQPPLGDMPPVPTTGSGVKPARAHAGEQPAEAGA
jgi:hypothetical protein